MPTGTAQAIISTRRWHKWLNIAFALLLFSMLFGSLWMASTALQHATRFEHLYTLLLIINVIALFALISLVGLNLGQLLQQVRRERAGARVTVRLVGLLVILAVIPASVVYYFSLDFLNQRLDSWFDVNVQQSLQDALELSKASLDAKMRDALKQTHAAATEIGLMEMNTANTLPILLDELSHLSDANELTLLGANGQIVASSTTAELGQLLPTAPAPNYLLQLQRDSQYITLEEVTGDGRLQIRAVVKFQHNNQPHVLHALYPISSRLSELANNVGSAYEAYQARAYLKQYLSLSFSLLLSLVLMLSIASTIWIAFMAARRFVEPLSDLVRGTRAVAKGDYTQQLPVKGSDELGFLMQSFNNMTRKIAHAQADVQHSQQLADRQRLYLEAVLGRLSSGVITLNHRFALRTVNMAAENILEVTLTQRIGDPFLELHQFYPHIAPLTEVIQQAIVEHFKDWREEVTLFGKSGRKILSCRGTEFESTSEIGQQRGYVIVFDDVTALIQAQRDAAWSEVARRLAHEIRNPLTPIQLSAERLQHKYLKILSESDSEPLKRLTHTIIQQVESLKEMVNAFSEYAKSPQIAPQQLNLNHLINEVVDLYQHTQPSITLHLDTALPPVAADRLYLRQVLHNLIKNALEADSHNPRITISSRYRSQANWECAEIQVQDQGPGIPPDLLTEVFEPYKTTKTKGTGLGLAIVKKVIEEHGGMVWIENQGGACVTIRLPVKSVLLLS